MVNHIYSEEWRRTLCENYGEDGYYISTDPDSASCPECVDVWDHEFSPLLHLHQKNIDDLYELIRRHGMIGPNGGCICGHLVDRGELSSAEEFVLHLAESIHNEGWRMRI